MEYLIQLGYDVVPKQSTYDEDANLTFLPKGQPSVTEFFNTTKVTKIMEYCKAVLAKKSPTEALKPTDGSDMGDFSIYPGAKNPFTRPVATGQFEKFPAH